MAGRKAERGVTPWGRISAAIRDALHLEARRGIVEWASDSIDFSGDVSAERSRLDLNLSPFLVEPLRAWEFSGKIREVTVCAPEQHGKTLLEVVGVLYCMVFKPCSMLCVYPSDDLAEDINKQKYEPLIRKIPKLAADLARPYAAKADRYLLGGSTMFFQGAGRKVMSKSCKVVVLDEEDQAPHLPFVNVGEDARKRTRSYSESLFYRVCTPTEEDGAIWKSFLAGSQGYWHLRCLGCGCLTMRSCDFQNFQFESEYDEERRIYQVIPGTERLVCPSCHHEHQESDRCKMNQEGGYVHRFPERVASHPSFQFGALASQFAFMSWNRIASKILECGKRADIKSHYELDNSFRGMPYKEREVSTEDQQLLKNHAWHEPPPLGDVELCFVVSDTQDEFSPTGVFVTDTNDNVWLLRYANVRHLSLSQSERERIESVTGERLTTVEDILDTPVRVGGGTVRPMFHIVDWRGHRQDEVRAYASRHRNVFMYAGTGSRQMRFEPGKIPRMFLVDARHYQKSLIYYLYRQRSKASDFLFLPHDLDPKFQQEIGCVQPDKTRKSGGLPENWSPVGDAVHDAFDVLKMAYFAFDLALARIARGHWLQGRSRALSRLQKPKDESLKT